MPNYSYAERNESLEKLGFKSYRDYLQSAEWKTIRKRVFERCDQVCEVCRRDSATEVHHRSYSFQVMIGENISQLVGCCNFCHQNAEFDDLGNKVYLDEANRRIDEAIKEFQQRKGSRIEIMIQKIEEIIKLEYSYSGSKLLYSQVIDAMARTLPYDHGQRNASIFDFARAVKAIPSFREKEPNELESIFRVWHMHAEPTIKTKRWEDSWKDFQRSWKTSVRYLDQTSFEEICSIADRTPFPKCADNYARTAPKLLLRLCVALQKHHGTGVFFLSCLKAKEYLERFEQSSAMKASRWLKRLVADGVLTLVERGSWPEGKSSKELNASTYRLNPQCVQ